MQQILEFSEIEIPEKNPNPVNDIYKKDGTEGSVSALIGLLLISIMHTIVCVALWIFSIYYIVVFNGRNVYYFGIVIFTVMIYAGILWIKVNIRDLCRVGGYRKKIFANGTAYPGVVAEVEAYARRGGTARFGTLKWEEYTMRIKYVDDSFWVSGLETDPQKCLENPYCTVYVWNGKAIATDFKLREEYIASNGKTYLTKPRKKGKRK